MQLNWQQLLRAVILLFFTLYIFKLHFSGEILKLINPKYETLSQIGASLFLFLFLVQMQRVFSPVKPRKEMADDAHQHDHGDQPMTMKKIVSYIIIMFPLTTGMFLPLSSLDASIAKNKGASLSLTNYGSSREKNQSLQEIQEKQDISEDIEENDQPPGVEEKGAVDDNPIDPNVFRNKISKPEYDQLKEQLKNTSHLMLEEELFATIYQEIMDKVSLYEGKEITLSGFVYKEDDFSDHQLVLGRFLITHCVADAGMIGFLTEFDNADSFSEDRWLKITGTIAVTEYQGVEIPSIQVSEFEAIEEPDQPYVYPLQIEIISPNG
ncbi:TIGR03943 family protein [Gracilibacillus sp. YIM 98692]|uniref:TIGR03943 family putative permease subunit n=1 Tax=Gracilibacillus sp. YIM 98692 TaxID=2663532 RepID=UPI0013D20D6F|nr:TIGR03943 family protein [Gracilibacillus sp. YIM 98692]